MRARLRGAQEGRRPPRFPARAARLPGAVRHHQRAARGQVAERGRQARRIGPALKNEMVIYTAHWDHLGRDPALQGDQIYNGAADNASGVAAVLEIARALTQVKPAPKRSILFLAVTAEEKGLLGAKYYAAHPLYPLDRTLADINLDVINLWGPTKDIISIGMGNSTLDDLLVEIAQAARPHGRSRRRAREGILLPLRPLRVRQARGPGARSQGGTAIHRQVRRLRPAETGRVHRQGLPQAQRRGEARLGPLRRRRGPAGSWPSSAIAWPREIDTPSGSRTASSEPGARRCSRRTSHDPRDVPIVRFHSRQKGPSGDVGTETVAGFPLPWSRRPWQRSAAWLDARYGWITPAFDAVAHQFYEVPLLAAVRRPSQLVLVRWHLAIGSALLVLGLLLAPWLGRHGRAWLAIFGIGYAIRAVIWICGGNLPLVPGDSCHYLEVATSVLRGEGPVKHYVESFFSDYPRIRAGPGRARRLGDAAGCLRARAGLSARRSGPGRARSRRGSSPPRRAASSSTCWPCPRSTSSLGGDIGCRVALWDDGRAGGPAGPRDLRRIRAAGKPGGAHCRFWRSGR